MKKEIDELLIKTIKILNEKGYITEYSCQGHLNNKPVNTYIKFKDLDISKKIKSYKKIRFPKGFYFESCDTIRKNYDKNITEEDIEKSCKSLERWANRLPNIDVIDENYKQLNIEKELNNIPKIFEFNTTDEVKKMLKNDTIRLIERVGLPNIKSELKKLKVKGYSKLKRDEAIGMLLNEFEKSDINVILDFYEENKVNLGMFKKEVLEVLEMSDHKFNKIKNNMKVVGKKKINTDFKVLDVDMYDREYIYNYKFNENQFNK